MWRDTALTLLVHELKETLQFPAVSPPHGQKPHAQKETVVGLLRPDDLSLGFEFLEFQSCHCTSWSHRRRPDEYSRLRDILRDPLSGSSAFFEGQANYQGDIEPWCKLFHPSHGSRSECDINGASPWETILLGRPYREIWEESVAPLRLQGTDAGLLVYSAALGIAGDPIQQGPRTPIPPHLLA